jgi:hypothetical protein
MASVYNMKGVQDELEVFDDKLTITPKGVLGMLNKGFQGTKTIPFSSITAIQFKQASTFISGYLQFSIFGGRESTGGILAAATDENSFMFKEKNQNELAEKIKNFIEEKIKSQKTSSLVKGSGPAEEISKLFELKEKGVITEEDFQKAKEKLLGT